MSGTWIITIHHQSFKRPSYVANVFYVVSDESCNRQSLLMNICHFLYIPSNPLRFQNVDVIEKVLKTFVVTSIHCAYRHRPIAGPPFFRSSGNMSGNERMSRGSYTRNEKNYLLVFVVVSHSLIRLFDVVAYCMTNHFNSTQRHNDTLFSISIFFALTPASAKIVTFLLFLRYLLCRPRCATRIYNIIQFLIKISRIIRFVRNNFLLDYIDIFSRKSQMIDALINGSFVDISAERRKFKRWNDGNGWTMRLPSMTLFPLFYVNIAHFYHKTFVFRSKRGFSTTISHRAKWVKYLEQ